MIIKLHTFKGQNKLYPAYAMPIELGQQAVNTYIENGTLKPMLGDTIFYLPDTVRVPEGTKTIFKNKNVNNGESEWHFFNSITSVTRHPVGTDIYQRIYFIEDGKLKYKRFDWPDAYDVLMPQPNPQNQLTVTVNDGGAGDIQRFIAFTLVNNMGEETALSLTTSGMDEYQYGNYYIKGLGTDSSITVFWDKDLIVPGGGTYEDFVKIRFYMTPVTTTSDDYKFAGEAYITDENILILNAGNDLSISENINSPVRLTYDDYSTVTLLGVCKTTFGSIITWDAGNVYISDQKHPYIFSAMSTYSIESEILSVNPFGTSFLVTTTTNPSILTGTDPTAMLTEKAEQARGCLNKDCIVDMGSFICVPTDEGIYKIGTGTFELATKDMFSLSSWRDTIGNGDYLSTATQYKNLYLLNLTTGVTLVFDFINNFFWELDYKITMGYYDPLEQKLYYRLDDTLNTRLLLFNQDVDNVKTYTFRTGKVMLNAPVNFKYVRVYADDYDGTITLKAYDTGVLKITRTITTDDIVKLPSIKFNEVELEIISDRVINFVNVSTAMEEILGA